MKSALFIVFVFVFFLYARADKPSVKTSKAICDCIHNIDQALPPMERKSLAKACVSDAIEKHKKALGKQYDIDDVDSEAGREKLGKVFTGEMLNGCPDLTAYLFLNEKSDAPKSSVKFTDTLKLDPAVCAQFKSGRFTAPKGYVAGKMTDNPDTTAYSEIKDGIQIDYYEGNKYFSRWSIRWISDCEWEETMIESSEPTMKRMKPGTKILCKAVGSVDSRSIWVEVKIWGLNMYALYVKQ